MVCVDWKEHRRLRRFSGRGLARGCAQVGLMVLAHNSLTLLDEQSKATGPRLGAVNSTEIAA
jgi:hypothetical protein